MSISLVEQAVFRPPACAEHPETGDWRAYRIETGYECGCPEGIIWLPAHVDANSVEDFLNEVIHD